ncbi:DUF1499 domain-containing protein [Roseovarius sp. EL26]|uniref:DUF1499 domain-containing protein n=1 Tax=Roseovarius sp. EL26 TaxID=2126672 RepID=UPI000EA12CC3|nr:DUF1499 domain-containing protein [Roseovarius sp. EL26]
MSAIFLILAVVTVSFGIYVRTAPSPAQTWHQLPAVIATKDLPGGAMRVVDPANRMDLQYIHEIALQGMNTKQLSGSIEEDMITYISRSKFWGFPDYTTVRLQGGRLELYGRLRFGRSDFGVNASRIDHWLRLLSERG